MPTKSSRNGHKFMIKTTQIHSQNVDQRTTYPDLKEEFRNEK